MLVLIANGEGYTKKTLLIGSSVVLVNRLGRKDRYIGGVPRHECWMVMLVLVL